MENDDGDADVISEAAKVSRWRRDQFKELGYGHLDAIELDRAGVDPHELKKLIGAGC